MRHYINTPSAFIRRVITSPTTMIWRRSRASGIRRDLPRLPGHPTDWLATDAYEFKRPYVRTLVLDRVAEPVTHFATPSLRCKGVVLVDESAAVVNRVGPGPRMTTESAWSAMVCGGCMHGCSKLL